MQSSELKFTQGIYGFQVEKDQNEQDKRLGMCDTFKVRFGRGPRRTCGSIVAKLKAGKPKHYITTRQIYEKDCSDRIRDRRARGLADGT
jgi:hypothetical protein